MNAPLLRPTARAAAPGMPAMGGGGSHNYYTYAVKFTAVAAAGGAQSQQVLIDEDADFEWMEGTFFSVLSTGVNQTASSRLIPNALLTISTQDTQRISNIPLPIGMWFGDGGQPFVLPRARRFRRKAQLLFEITNNDPAETLTLWLGMSGQKVFFAG